MKFVLDNQEGPTVLFNAGLNSAGDLYLAIIREGLGERILVHLDTNGIVSIHAGSGVYSIIGKLIIPKGNTPYIEKVKA